MGTSMPSEALWRKYAMYNREMVKFLQKDDIDMFLTLREQLVKTYDQIEATPKDGYTDSVDGKALIVEMKGNLRFMQLAVQRWLNDAKQKQEVVNAYGHLGIPTAGNLKDWNG